MLFLRPITWLATGIVASAAFGLAWFTQTVEVPIWGLLMLTFVPLESTVGAIKARLPDPDNNRNNG
jgi:hypothetical protein